MAGGVVSAIGGAVYAVTIAPLVDARRVIERCSSVTSEGAEVTGTAPAANGGTVVTVDVAWHDVREFEAALDDADAVVLYEGPEPSPPG